jgi:hypothetical protein
MKGFESLKFDFIFFNFEDPLTQLPLSIDNYIIFCFVA